MRIDHVLQDSSRELAARDTSHWPTLLERVIDDLHPYQRAFALDDGRYVAELVGRGGGKTTGGIVRFLRRMLTRRGARCFYVALTKDHARDVIWLDWKMLLVRIGFVEGVDVIHNETKLTSRFTRNGATLKLVGADRPRDIDKLRGPTYAEIGIDEMGAQTDRVIRYLIEQVIGPRLVGSYWLAGTPGLQPQGLWYEITGPGSSISRLWKDRHVDTDKQWSVHKWTLADAIEATKDRPIEALLEIQEAQRAEIKARNLSPDNPQRRREFDAEWTQDNTEAIYKYRPFLDDGKPWNQWDPERVGLLKIAKLPEQFKEWVHVVALDLGSSDPTSINVFATALDDKTCTIYHRYWFEQKRLYAKPIAMLLLGEHLDHARPGGIIGAIGRWPNGMCADATHLGQAVLDELRDVYGISIEPAAKGWHYKLGAIEVLNGDLFDGRFVVLKGSPLEEQLMKLQWAMNSRGELVEPRGPRNDSADCAVYGRQLLAEFMTARGEAPPDEQEDAASAPSRPAPWMPPVDDGNMYDSVYDDDD